MQKFVSQTEDIVLRLKEARDYVASKHKYDLSEQAFDSLDYFSILDYDVGTFGLFLIYTDKKKKPYK